MSAIFDRSRWRREDASSASDPQGSEDLDASFPLEEVNRLRLEQIARSAFGAEEASEGGEPGEDPPPPAPGAGSDPRTMAAVLEAARDGIVLFGAGGEIVDWNPAAERILGYPRDRAVGRNVLELIFPLRLRPAMEGVIRSRGAGWGDSAYRSIEVALRSDSGEEIPVELTLSWASGSGLFAAHLCDAQERSQRERELAAETRRRSRLLTLGELALNETHLEKLFEPVLAAAAAELGLDRCEIWELESGSGELTLLGRRGKGAAEVGATARVSDGSDLVSALRSRSSSIVTGNRTQPNPWLAPEEFAAGAPTGIAVVIARGERPLGVLTGTAGVGRFFSDIEKAFFESLAQLLASAIERDHFTTDLSDAERRIRTLIEGLPSVTYRAELGTRGKWLFISRQIEDLLGLSPEECRADPGWWERQVHPDDLDRVMAEEDRCAAERAALDVEYRIQHNDGRELWVRDRASIGMSSEEGVTVVEGLLADITTEKEAELKLRHLAEHDHLTQLLNRRGFEARVDAWLAARVSGASATLGIIDLDHLKLINDSRGHAAGDIALQEMAELIAGAAGEDDIVGRLSGDEFGLFTPGSDAEAAKPRFDEMITLIRRHGGHGGHSLTASAGVTMLRPDDSASAADLLVQADLALYHAKQGGRDRVALADEHDHGRLHWVGVVREAIDSERLVLYGQPIIDLASGETHGHELLVRMLDAEGEPIPAGQFIPTAERFGMIGKVDHWVAQQAVGIAAAGNRVSVNISAASISDDELTDTLQRRISAARVDPALITFEITETVATPTIETLRDFADRIGAMGCRLALDDVGTGFGSLTYLQNLEFSELKIDIAFVQRILESPTDLGIVRSLVIIAGELGLSTVAEGVGSDEAADLLRELGVDRAQGFHLGMPHPVAEIVTPAAAPRI